MDSIPRRMVTAYFRITDNDVDENGRIDHIDVSNHEYICCDGLTRLVELPCWEHVKHVSCCRCPQLKTLPLWPAVEVVICNFCINLVEFPLWPKVVIVQCENTSIESFPQWENISTLSCPKCVKIKTFPLWPKISVINCYNCVNLESLPDNFPNIVILLGDVNPKIVSYLMDPSVRHKIFEEFDANKKVIVEEFLIYKPEAKTNEFVKKNMVKFDDTKCVECKLNKRSIVFNNCDNCYHLSYCDLCAIKRFFQIRVCRVCNKRFTKLVRIV